MPSKPRRFQFRRAVPPGPEEPRRSTFLSIIGEIKTEDEAQSAFDEELLVRWEKERSENGDDPRGLFALSESGMALDEAEHLATKAERAERRRQDINEQTAELAKIKARKEQLLRQKRAIFGALKGAIARAESEAQSHPLEEKKNLLTSVAPSASGSTFDPHHQFISHGPPPIMPSKTYPQLNTTMTGVVDLKRPVYLSTPMQPHVFRQAPAPQAGGLPLRPGVSQAGLSTLSHPVTPSIMSTSPSIMSSQQQQSPSQQPQQSSQQQQQQQPMTVAERQQQQQQQQHAAYLHMSSPGIAPNKYFGQPPISGPPPAAHPLNHPPPRPHPPVYGQPYATAPGPSPQMVRAAASTSASSITGLPSPSPSRLAPSPHSPRPLRTSGPVMPVATAQPVQQLARYQPFSPSMLSRSASPLGERSPTSSPSSPSPPSSPEHLSSDIMTAPPMTSSMPPPPYAMPPPVSHMYRVTPPHRYHRAMPPPQAALGPYPGPYPPAMMQGFRPPPPMGPLPYRWPGPVQPPPSRRPLIHPSRYEGAEQD